jgi:hypothetical protein
MVKAAEPGIVTKVDQLQVGSYVTASTPVFSMVSKRVWIEANFKETELTNMHPGQTATVEIDTYPGVVFNAKVESLSLGTGLTFCYCWPKTRPETGSRSCSGCRCGCRSKIPGPAAACRVERDGQRSTRNTAGRGWYGCSRRPGYSRVPPRRARRIGDRRGEPLSHFTAHQSRCHHDLDHAGDVHAGRRHDDHQRRAAAHAGQSVRLARQIAWVVTSYIVAAAIMTPLTGWLPAGSASNTYSWSR